MCCDKNNYNADSRNSKTRISWTWDNRTVIYEIMFKVVKTGKNNQKPQNGWGTINKRPVEKELLKKKKRL